MQNLAQGISIGIDPQLALTCHVQILPGQVEVNAGWKLTLLNQVFFHLVAHVNGIGMAINIKRKTRSVQCDISRCAFTSYVFRGGEKGQEVTLRGKQFGEIIDLLPVLYALSGIGMVTLNFDLDTAASVQDAATLRPQCQMELMSRQVGLALQVKNLCLTGATYVTNGRLRNSDLFDVGAEAVDARLTDVIPDSSKIIGLCGRGDLGTREHNQ
ncbi:MAG TPA: hypothetical protein PLJ24_01825 [Anaerolineae bacterium]|nr:hypothetical protein [Anaerolineae bacterium]HQJ10609.1 hypothetical protein [Anaerolineae bacterium]